MAGTSKMFIKKGNVVVMFRQVGELREAVTLTSYGCTYTEDITKFHSKEEGNQYYKMCIDDGFVKVGKNEYDRIVRGY